MKFDAKGLGLACAILWGAVMLFMGVANMVWSGYGQDFLKVMASVYPGYHAVANLPQVVVGTVYGILDGLLGGFVFGWLYNRMTQA
jgi:hypothetical protein